jgi:hypothetical protein
MNIVTVYTVATIRGDALANGPAALVPSRLGEIDACLHEVADLLQWSGTAIPELELLGDRVRVVAALNSSEHERRRATGVGALTNPWLLELQEGPCQERPARWRASPVSIAGVFAYRMTWRAALTAAAGFAGFCSRAVVVPPRQAYNRRLWLESGVRGVGIVARDSHELALVQPPALGPVPGAQRSLVHRVVEEAVYERLITSLTSLR